MWFIQSVKGNWASHWQSQCADRTVQLQQHHHAGTWQKTQYEESFEILILKKEHLANNLRGAVLWSQKTSCITPIATPPNWCLIKIQSNLPIRPTVCRTSRKMTRQTWSSIILWHIRQTSKPANQQPNPPPFQNWNPGHIQIQMLDEKHSAVLCWTRKKVPVHQHNGWSMMIDDNRQWSMMIIDGKWMMMMMMMMMMMNDEW